MRKVVVTGCNKGIGYGIVQALASKTNWSVIMACRNIQLGEKARQELLNKFNHAQLTVEPLDVSSEKSIHQFVKNIHKKHRTIDVLVNNAGVAPKDDTLNSDIAKFTLDTVKNNRNCRIFMEQSNSPKECYQLSIARAKLLLYLR